ncbi:DNA gyrase inhibitor YacG [Pontibaca salina]|uniref:DNA gyrase inhibitor YacG n=1 Tax=Pontibaca salina TaxID=2795731 RepID=A0A934M248_9RHOB|nr:DNA gyrase inhibitor YacG [Pontibaca salina]MBI6628439.1 DNA gyrase inhibitor YacG [Pontibaca salina]
MKCPLCQTPTDRNWRPFCSASCADLDLVKWLRGSYAIASHEPEDIEQAQQQLCERLDKPNL